MGRAAFRDRVDALMVKVGRMGLVEARPRSEQDYLELAERVRQQQERDDSRNRVEERQNRLVSVRGERVRSELTNPHRPVDLRPAQTSRMKGDGRAE